MCIRDRLYIGHTQSASLRIRMFDTPTGKLVRTSDRLSFKAANAADSRFEHFRHMVYSQDSDTPVSYTHLNIIRWNVQDGSGNDVFTQL